MDWFRWHRAFVDPCGVDEFFFDIVRAAVEPSEIEHTALIFREGRGADRARVAKSAGNTAVRNGMVRVEDPSMPVGSVAVADEIPGGVGILRVGLIPEMEPETADDAPVLRYPDAEAAQSRSRQYS